VGVRWPGVLILLGGLLGYTSFRLFVLFSVGVYLNRKIKRVVEFTRKPARSRKGQFDLAISGGLGAGFGLVMYSAVVDFAGARHPNPLLELLGILLVSVAIVKFVEPVAEWARHGFHTEEHPSPVALKRPWVFRGAIFLVVIVSSFSHDLLRDT